MTPCTGLSSRLGRPSAPEIIAKTFNLTPTDLRVLLGIVEMGRVSDTADALGIGQATVKTHLHRLFRKNRNHPCRLISSD